MEEAAECSFSAFTVCLYKSLICYKFDVAVSYTLSTDADITTTDITLYIPICGVHFTFWGSSTSLSLQVLDRNEVKLF